jgi:hypothetical protein
MLVGVASAVAMPAFIEYQMRSQQIAAPPTP